MPGPRKSMDGSAGSRSPAERKASGARPGARAPGRRRSRWATPSGAPDDINLCAAGLLYDMAALQPHSRSQFGYKRAAAAVVALPVSVSDLVSAGTLRAVPYIGPASAAIIAELVETGASKIVDAALAVSGHAARITALRGLRANFLSRFAVEQVLHERADPAVVTRECVRGDFQMHSTWSDGAAGLEGLTEACMELGHTCLGITDHSHGLPVARGMTMAEVVRQHSAIDRLNRRYAGRYRIFKGIEANILADGSLDLAADECRVFEFIVAAPHSLLRRDHDQTPRMLAAVRQPGVAILGHPRGRVFNSRAGILAEWPRVFAEAARRGVAVEIDGSWHRQDVDHGLAAAALAAGCLFALDSDAHSVAELQFVDYAVAHARLAGIPAERVINCWSNERLEAWMEERRRSAVQLRRK